MRKILAVILVSGLLLATFPAAALAGDTHAVSNRWAGAAIGAAAAAVVGGILLNAFQAPAATPPAAYSPPPVVYSTPTPQVVYSAPPPVVYAPPAVVYSAPPVVYAPAPVVVHRAPHPPVHWDRGYYEHGDRWSRH